MLGLKLAKYGWPVFLWLDKIIGIHALGFRSEVIDQNIIKKARNWLD